MKNLFLLFSILASSGAYNSILSTIQGYNFIKIIYKLVRYLNASRYKAKKLQRNYEAFLF